MPKKLVWIAGLVAAVAMVGCSRPKTWSCNNPEKHACSEWSSGTATSDVTAKQRDACGRMGGVVADAPCATAGAVGSCDPAAAGSGGRMVFYAPRNSGDAERICRTLAGTWNPR